MNDLQIRLKNDIVALCSLMSVSGFERRAREELYATVGKDFDTMQTDAVGNHVLLKKCGREGAPLVLVDAHFDEIGMLVTEICEGGFLRFCNMGGLSLSVLQAADVIVYGKEEIRGVIISTPPHLRDGSSDKLSDISELMIDTGYSKEALEKLAPVGTPVGFAPVYSHLLSGRIAGKSFDDKACAAVCAAAIADTPREELAADVCLMLSCFEETSRLGGIAPAVNRLQPDYAMVVDVNLARVPDTPKSETVPMGKGISISVSAATDRALSLEVARLCREGDIPHTMVAAPSSTGTNAPTVNLSGAGIPVVDIGLPLANMHTYNEVIDLLDCESLYRLTRAFITDRGLAEKFMRRGEELPL